MLNKLLNKLFHSRPAGRFVGRQFTKDVAIQFRMGAGFPGDVNRTHPASIEPCLIDASAPPTLYGQPVLVDNTTQGVRPYAAADQSDSVDSKAYGFTVRPYPTQQAQAATDFAPATLGSATPPVSGAIDILRLGYIMAKVNGSPKKGDAVYVWAAASSGAHVLGGLEAAADSGNTTKLSNATFNGSPDANGVVEVVVL